MFFLFIYETRQIVMKQAVTEDPSIYQYDEVIMGAYVFCTLTMHAGVQRHSERTAGESAAVSQCQYFLY